MPVLCSQPFPANSGSGYLAAPSSALVGAGGDGPRTWQMCVNNLIFTHGFSVHHIYNKLVYQRIKLSCFPELVEALWHYTGGRRGAFPSFQPFPASFSVTTSWHVYSVWGPGVHGMPPWLIACSLLCIVKHFGSCDGERHGVIVFSVPSLKMVKRSPDSCQYMVDRGVAWPENQEKLEYGFRFNVFNCLINCF